MFRRVIAGVILGPALLIGSFAWWGFLSLRTVFDENRTQTIAEELLDNEAVTEQIGENIGKAIERATPESVELTEAQVAAAVDIILTDPVVRELIIGSLGTTHRAFLGLDDAPSEIDLGPALTSARDRIAEVDTTVAAQIPEAFEVELPTERIPDASPVKRFLERVVPLLAGIALTMTLLAFLTTSDRSHVLGKAARWAIGTTAFYLIVGLGIPALLRRFAPEQAEVLAALLSAVLRAALVPSIVLGVVGLVLLLLSMFWPDPGRSRSRSRSAAPAPAPVEPARHVHSPARVAPATPAAAPVRPPVPDATTILPTPDPAPAAPAPAPAAPTPAPVPRPRPPERAAAPDATQSPARPILPTRAKPPEASPFPAWTGEPTAEPGPVAPPASSPEKTRWLAPMWVPEHGWVMDPADPREPPNNARFVEGVGWVVPGPPPTS